MCQSDSYYNQQWGTKSNKDQSCTAAFKRTHARTTCTRATPPVVLLSRRTAPELQGMSNCWRAPACRCAGITHVSPWELTPLLPQQLPQQQQQQKVHEQLSGANLRNALQSMLGDRNASQRTQDRPDLLQMPTLHTRCVNSARNGSLHMQDIAYHTSSNSLRQDIVSAKCAWIF